MPRIREYTPQVGAIGPVQGRRATPSDFGAGIGEAISGAGRQTVQLGSFLREQEEQREVSDVRAKMAKARAEWTMHLQERARTAKPGDTEFVKQFNEDLTNYLGELEGGLQTRRGRDAFNQLGAALAGDLTERAFTHQAALAGAKAKIDVQTQIDQWQSTLLTDPTQLSRGLEDITASMQANPHLQPGVRVELEKIARNQLSGSAVKGLIHGGNPEGALELLRGGHYDKDLTGEAKASLIGEAQTAIRGKEVEQRRQEAERKAALKEEQKATGAQFVELVHEGKLTPQQVLQSNLDPTGENSKEHWLNVIRTRAKEVLEKPVRTQPSEFSKVLTGIRSGEITSETEIEKYYTHKRTVSWDDVKELRRELQEFRTPEGERLNKVKDSFLKGMKPQIDKSNPMMGRIDQTGAAQFYNFEHYVNQRIAQERKKDGGDVYSLFDPQSPNYLGKAVSQFQRSLQDSADELARGLRRGSDASRTRVLPGSPSAADDNPKARRPGETPAQYLERIGAK